MIPLEFRDGAEICRNDSIGLLIHGFLKTLSGRFSTNMWTEDYFFVPPCTYNTYTYVESAGKNYPVPNNEYITMYLKKKRDRTRILRLYFNSKMFVTEQFWNYPFMAYVAECGGFVGLFLGFSILQIADLLQYLCGKFRNK